MRRRSIAPLMLAEPRAITGLWTLLKSLTMAYYLSPRCAICDRVEKKLKHTEWIQKVSIGRFGEDGRAFCAGSLSCQRFRVGGTRYCRMHSQKIFRPRS